LGWHITNGSTAESVVHLTKPEARDRLVQMVCRAFP
jgi:hypothetical protein